MQYLNIIYFLIITIYGYRFLQSDGKIIKGTLNSEQSFHYSGTELFWCLTFSTGLLAFSANIGLDLMAIRLLVLELFCIIGISIAKNRAILSLPLKMYIIFLLWMVVGLFYTPSPIYGIRSILKYLYPLLLCCFASAVVRDEEVFLKSSLLARSVGTISLLWVFLPFLDSIFPGVIWYGTARAINYISIMIFSLGMFYFTNKKIQNLLYTILLCLPCILWVFRTSIMGSLVAIMAFFFIKYRLKSLPIIFGTIVLGIAAVFTVPAIKQKMFFDDSVTFEDYRTGKMSEENVNTNYRSTMWKNLNRMFYQGHEIAGSGTGAVQAYMYAHPEEFGMLTVPHSDFVQQKCDNGLIGLVLYCAMTFFIFVDAFRTYWRARSAPLQLCAIVAGASMVGVFATLYSDNVVNYSMATLSMPYGFYGMMLGLRHTEQSESV